MSLALTEGTIITYALETAAPIKGFDEVKSCYAPLSRSTFAMHR
ncbi:MAG: hypothetical protein AAGD43_00025 [Pseudomonadota bacterium]